MKKCLIQLQIVFVLLASSSQGLFASLNYDDKSSLKSFLQLGNNDPSFEKTEPNSSSFKFFDLLTFTPKNISKFSKSFLFKIKNQVLRDYFLYSLSKIKSHSSLSSAYFFVFSGLSPPSF